MVGGHAELQFENCFVDDGSVLGDVDRGFEHALARLAPARLTHCMRWLGIARRSLDIALDRTAERTLFGTPLHKLGLAQGLIADSAIDIESTRALVGHACVELDAGREALHLSSIAKVQASEAIYRVVDRSIQLCGGAGVTHDTLLARFLTETRAFRIYDGPSETHRWSIAREVVRRRAEVRS
jgi:alkylation response protein AidB-like acyl-CoA dehydrogenase